jgi:pimeloyl-ACP methyl ester carboxylesterase
VEQAVQDNGRRQALAARRRLFEGTVLVEQVIEAAGVATAVWMGGDGQPLVLLHGQGGSALAWLPNVDQLASRYRVVIPDLPGLGESTFTGDVDENRAVDWLEGLIEATVDTPPVVVGLSLGGSIGIRHALRHPAAIDRLVLADSGSLAPFRPDPRLIPPMLRLMRRPSRPNLERFFRQTVFDFEGFKSRMGSQWDDWARYGLERTSTPEVRQANQLMLRRIGIPRVPDADLATIQVPVTLIWGAHDRVMKPGIARRASQHFGWPLHMLAEAGHVSAWDRPEAFAAAVMAG